MSDEQNSKENQAPAAVPARQPIFLLPTGVAALAGLMIAIHLAKTLVLNEEGQQTLALWFAFIPYRLVDPTAGEGGLWPLLWTPFTHAFLHAGWEHLLGNVAWLVIFATPVARRYGATRMLILFFIGALAGALLFAATTLPQIQVLLGASGAIAALTGAAVRFIFQPVIVAVDPETGERHAVGRHLASLSEFIRSPTARFFALIWIVLNGVVPLVPLLFGTSVEIAWQAHLGGFVAGFLLVPLFERRPERIVP